MLIGISGKIGSGKDTLARLIQYASCKIDKGELSATDALDHWEDGLQGNKRFDAVWQVRKYGEKLKQIASMLTGIPREKFEDQQFKTTCLGPEWNYWEDDYHPDGTFDAMRQHGMTVREFLQKLGNDALRFKLHQAVWTNALFSEFTPECNWIISDMRYPNEAECIKGRGGIVVRITRPNNPYPESAHISETALDDYKFDYEIKNEGSIEDLVIKAGALLMLANNQDGTNRGYPW